MTKERNELLYQILSERSRDGQWGIMGSSTEPSTKQPNGTIVPGLDRNSDTVKRLEQIGFKVIYPAPLSEDMEDRMSVGRKKVYDLNKNYALVIDSREKTLSLSFEQLIHDCYFKHGMTISGVDSKNNTVTRYTDNEFPPETNANYKKLLDDLGFQTEMDEHGSVIVSSDIPYPTVRKSLFEKIYNTARDKVQGTIEKLKNLVKSKKKDKENELDDRE